MALSLKLAGYPWDHITPLLTGDVVPEGIDLEYDTDHGLGPVADDPSCHGGEASLGMFMIDTSRGDRSYVGLPIFPMFAFRHRCFLVRRGTTIGDLKELEGKRVGMDGWPNSGNTWTRVTLGQAGRGHLEDHLGDRADRGAGRTPDTAACRSDAPPNVVAGPAGKSMVDLLLAGEIDVLVAAFMPTGFFSPESPIVPMIPDYRAAETAYYQEHGYIPAHHIVKLHREVVERDPWIVKSLMTAFTASKTALGGAAPPPGRHDAILACRAGGDGGHLRGRLAAVRPGAESEDADRLLPGPVQAEAGGGARRSEGRLRGRRTIPQRGRLTPTERIAASPTSMAPQSPARWPWSSRRAVRQRRGDLLEPAADAWWYIAPECTARRASMADYIYLVQMDIPAEKEADFNRIYDTQHVPELSKVPGVRRVTRYRLESANVDGVAKYAAIYELDAPDIPRSEVWKAASDRGDWASQIRPYTTNRSHLTFKRIE